MMSDRCVRRSERQRRGTAAEWCTADRRYKGAMTRVAVVTGGSAGLGRATVRELAARGWDVAVLARGQEGVDAAVAEVEAAGRRGLALVADVSDRDAVEAAADRVEQELGPIDLWVNGVMVGVFGKFLDTAPEDFERALHVTYLGFVNGTRSALSRMVPPRSWARDPGRFGTRVPRDPPCRPRTAVRSTRSSGSPSPSSPSCANRAARSRCPAWTCPRSTPSSSSG
ncbi:SDR family NAD(P)-dependent oxidoreductase [Curtobacterium flaccumfaciens pv. flaccumfaciens]